MGEAEISKISDTNFPSRHEYNINSFSFISSQHFNMCFNPSLWMSSKPFLRKKKMKMLVLHKSLNVIVSARKQLYWQPWFAWTVFHLALGGMFMKEKVFEIFCSVCMWWNWWKELHGVEVEFSHLTGISWIYTIDTFQVCEKSRLFLQMTKVLLSVRPLSYGNADVP